LLVDLSDVACEDSTRQLPKKQQDSKSVKDVALHLLGDDIDLLSRRRDGAPQPTRPASRLVSRSWWPPLTG
jgi:hypothetical protein